MGLGRKKLTKKRKKHKEKLRRIFFRCKICSRKKNELFFSTCKYYPKNMFQET